MTGSRRLPTRWAAGSAWPFVLLALLTLLPAAFVLWFMNDALTRETASAQQRVLESYRGQLRLVRSRLDPIWRAHARGLNASSSRPEERFERLVTEGAVDGAVLLTPSGVVEYPASGMPSPQLVDLDRRLQAAAAEPPAGRGRAIVELTARLNDYSTPVPATERLRLMKRVRELSPNVSLPTQAALDLSLEMLAAERPSPVPEVIRQTATPDIWALSSEDGRVIAFYRTGRLEAMMHDFLHQVAPAGITFIASPPDVPADGEAIAAGSWLPGWQLTFVPLDAAELDANTRGRRTLYLSVALAGIAVMTLVGVAAAGTVRRHLQVARLKTDLVAAASHELRTPLASMRVLVEGLLADPEFDPVKTREYLEMLAVENARLSRLIGNFLTFSRLDRRRHEFVLAPTRPSDIVGAAVAAVRDRLPEGCVIRADIRPDLPLVMVDADAVGTALVNLLDNAIKYTQTPKRIGVRAEPDGQASVAFAVEDNGIGIPLREQRRVFRRFYRVDQSLSRETSGIGLGLSIVELIVRGHGGTVSVRSEPGAGSTFTLRLPRAVEGGPA